MLMTSCRRWPLFTTLLLAVAPALCQSNRAVEVKAAPRLETAMIPDYPPIAVAAHITGKVTVMLTVQGGRVVSTKVKPSTQAIANTLQTATIRNLQTWRFGANVNGTFSVTYTYDIVGEVSDRSTNPRVEILPTLDVNIIARPVAIY